MKKISLFSCIIILMACCQPKKSDTSKISGQIDTIYTAPSDTSDWSTLNKYNKYSYLKDTDFFQNPLVVNGLKKILANNYASYSEHVLYSDLIALEKEDNFLVVQVHQLHSGGFDSMIFIDIQARKFYLFWLPGEVRDKSNRIYGERPIPNIIQKIIVDKMNEGWGHVAKFSLDSDSLKIELNNPADSF